MDRAQIAAQQKKLAEYRQQQDHTKQPDRPTSAAKQLDPQGQPFKEQKPMKPDFKNAHDNAVSNGVKNKPHSQVSPQLREQDAAQPAPGGVNGPKPPQTIGPEADRKAHLEQLRKTNEQAKARQEGADHGNMKDGKDHD